METTIEKINTYPQQERDVLLKAYNFAEKAHLDQKRASGEPYFIHPCAVAEVLIDLGLDSATIAAALLVIFYTDIGILGVAGVSCLVQILWYSLAVPLFAARVLKCSPRCFFAPVLRAFFAALLSLVFCLALNSVCDIKSWAGLIIAAGGAGVVSAVISFFGIFKSFKVRMQLTK